ncbi:DUF6398 domain-containing protein [Thiorhodococcus fuscus]|uniref:DUF6398 domain-containing protein n=1 Tax=Thiorhodococcus fuscus TaxID=527200 RepID=A0ABW4Y971_9GAMM
MYALGRVNFLFDPSQTPSVQADDLCAHFGLSTSIKTRRHGRSLRIALGEIADRANARRPANAGAGDLSSQAVRALARKSWARSAVPHPR